MDGNDLFLLDKNSSICAILTNKSASQFAHNPRTPLARGWLSQTGLNPVNSLNLHKCIHKHSTIAFSEVSRAMKIVKTERHNKLCKHCHLE